MPFEHLEFFKEKEKLGNAPGIAEALLKMYQKAIASGPDSNFPSFTVSDIVADTELASIFKWYMKAAKKDPFQEDGRGTFVLLAFLAMVDFGDESSSSASNYVNLIAFVTQSQMSAVQYLGQLLGAGMHASTVRQVAPCSCRVLWHERQYSSAFTL